jgi:hypothetical protein
MMLAGVGCRYDAGALGTSGLSDGETTAATSGGASSSSGSPSTSGLDTGATFEVPGTGDTSTSELGTTGPDVPTLVDLGLLARWYVDEASEGQDPPAVLDHHAPAVDLELVYSSSSPAYAELDGSRGLRWLAEERGGRAFAPILGTKLETELTAIQQATFEVMVAVTAVSTSASRYLNVGTPDLPSDISIGSPALDEVEVRWGELTCRFKASLTGARQLLHVVVDTPHADPLQRVRVYQDGVPLVRLNDAAPAQGEGLPLLPTSMIVLGNRTNGGRTFRGSLQYAAIYTVAFGDVEIQQNRSVLLESDDPR